MYKILLIKVLLAAGIILSLDSCNEPPTEITLVSDSLELNSFSSETVPLIISARTINTEIPAEFNRPLFLLGKTQDGLNHAITTLRYFKIPDFLSEISEDDILDAKLIMFPDGYYFDENSTKHLDFQVFELNKQVRQQETNYSEITENFADYFPNMDVGSFDGIVEMPDPSATLSNVSFEVDIDKSLILKWFKFKPVENSIREGLSEGTLDSADVDPYYYNAYGIGMVPSLTGNSDGIFRFLNYQPAGSDPDDYHETFKLPRIEVTINQSALPDSMETNKIYLAPSADLSFYVNTEEASNGDLVVQGGSSLRPQFTFDVSQLPPRAVVARAELTMHIDPERSRFGSFELDSVIWADNFPDSSGYVQLFSVDWDFQAAWTDTTDALIFPSLSSVFSGWNAIGIETGVIQMTSPRRSNPFAEYSINNLRSAAAERYFLDRFVFYGMDAEEGKRPVLRIIYHDLEKELN